MSFQLPCICNLTSIIKAQIPGKLVTSGTPETLSSLSKSRISLFNAHLALFSEHWHNYGHRIPSVNIIIQWIVLVTCLGSKSTTVTIGRPDNKQSRCRTGEECECEELCLRRGSPLVCRIICFVKAQVIHLPMYLGNLHLQNLHQMKTIYMIYI